MQAVSILKEKGIAVQVFVVGEGEESERLVFAAYQLGISENVSFLGKKSHTEVIEEMQKADIFLQYSHTKRVL